MHGVWNGARQYGASQYEFKAPFGRAFEKPKATYEATFGPI